MGRGRPRSSTQTWVEDCGVLDIALAPKPEAAFHSDSVWGRFQSQARRTDPYLDVTATWDDLRQTRERIQLTTTRPQFGGARYWYVCPSCGRRCGKLYAPEWDRRFACRICRDLVYEVQYRKRSLFGRWIIQEVRKEHAESARKNIQRRLQERAEQADGGGPSPGTFEAILARYNKKLEGS